MVRSLVRGFALFCVIALGLTQAADHASASLLNQEIKFNNREGSTGGGEFGIALWSNQSVDLFRTFCVQVNEYMNFNNKFIVKSINTYSAPDGNPLRSATAALYDQFQTGAPTLFGIASLTYDHTPNSAQHVQDANFMQKAIWHLQNQPGYSYANLPGKSKQMVNAAKQFVQNNPTYGTGDVMILNLTYTDGRPAQDQLYLVPSRGPLPVVPEPMSVMVWGGLGLVGLVAVRRKRANS